VPKDRNGRGDDPRYAKTLRVRVPRAQQVLLILDEHATFCRAVKRGLAGCFDEVMFASTRADAERLIRARTVTHLVTAYELADGQQSYAFVPEWRQHFSSLSRVVVFTDEPQLRGNTPRGIDAVQVEPLYPAALRSALKV
jgi:hypothetical protein